MFTARYGLNLQVNRLLFIPVSNLCNKGKARAYCGIRDVTQINWTT